MTVLSVLLTALIPLSYGISVCNKDPCDFDIQPGREYACGCNVNKCDIDVSENKGKDITLYTFAKKTRIRCRDEDSCQAAKILPGFDPNVTGLEIFCAGTARPEVEIECEARTACKDMNITSADIPVSLRATELDAFDEGILDCYGNGVLCTLVCSSDVESCTDAICDRQCDCTGKYCPGFTPAPTPSPVDELPDPTDPPPAPEPPVIPDYVTCDADNTVNGVCILEPQEKDIIVVERGKNVATLELRCNEEDQCKGIQVYSAANTTEIMCTAKAACADSLIFIGFIDILRLLPLGKTRDDFPDDQYDTVLADCEGIDACKEANVTIKGKFASTPMIMAMGESSFAESYLVCDTIGSTCKILCNVAKPQSCEANKCLGTCLASNLTTNPGGFGPRIDNRRSAAKTVVIGSTKGVVVLRNEQDDCRIDCGGEDDCQDIEIFSGCNKTEIICGKSSCKKAKIMIGELSNNLPNGATAADFSGSKYQVVIIGNAYDALSEAEITIVGTVADVSITGLMPNALYKTKITSMTSDVIVTCNNGDSCKDTLIECAEVNNCVCDGGSCMDKDKSSNNAVDYTPAPTAPTTSPTDKPTPAPTDKPTEAPTSSDLIVYTPNREGVFICKNNVGTCILDCNDAEAQCDEDVVLLSAADITEVNCDKPDTCKNIKLFFGEAVTQTVLDANHITECGPDDFVNALTRSITVNCSAASGCKEGKIKADVLVSTGVFIITSNQDDALKDTIVDIKVGVNETCQVGCGDNGCKDSRFQRNTVGQCKCDAGTCPSAAQRQKGINYVPNGGMNMNVKHGGSHYPTFLPTAIIVCISIGLICLVSFCIYYKYFTNQEKKLTAYNDNNLLNNDGNYDTFNKKTTALEMNQF